MTAAATAKPRTTLAELDSVCRTYGTGDTAVHALRDVNLQIGRGEFIVVLGPSGSGKTTLLNVLGGIERPTSGRIVVDGRDLSALDSNELTEVRRDVVGFVFQFFNLIATLTAKENVAVLAELTGKAAPGVVDEVLREVGLSDRADHFPGQLSGGQQQRVAIARALVKQPPLLLADEPTGSPRPRHGSSRPATPSQNRRRARPDGPDRDPQPGDRRDGRPRRPHALGQRRGRRAQRDPATRRAGDLVTSTTTAASTPAQAPAPARSARRHPTLRRKLIRDIRRQWPQFTAVIVAVLLGVMLYAAAYDAYQNLKASYARVFADEQFADVWVTGPTAPQIAQRAASSSGIAAVSTRTQTDLPLRIGSDKLRGRLVGVPASGQPSVDKLTILQGTYPTAASDVAVEHHVAEHFHLKPGDHVSVFGANGWRELRVAAIVSSAEYLWPARSRQEPMTTPDDFGVVFAPQPFVDQVAPTAPQQALIRLDPGAGGATLTRVEQMARSLGATDIVTRAQQPSNSLLQEDISGYSELSYLFPLLFLTAAGMATYVLLTRRVDSEREVIGMLLASGVRRRTILGHYLSYGLAAAAIGAVAGVVVGEFAGGILSHYYLRAINLPKTSTVIAGFRWTTIVVGLAFGVIAGGIAALAPARAASRVDPARAMRGIAATRVGHASAFERLVPPLRRAPARVRLVLRNVGRNRRRTTFTMVGVVLSLLVILTSWTMLDTINALLHKQFDVVTKQDARVELTTPVDASVLASLKAVPGVVAAEPELQAPVSLVNPADPTASYATALIGLPADTTMHGFEVAGGGSTTFSTLADGDVLVGQAVRSKLGVRRGSTVNLVVAGKSHVARIAGFLDEPMGTFVYAPLPTAQSLTGGAAPTSALLKFSPTADHAAVRRAVNGLPNVAAYEDAQALNTTYRQYSGLFYVFIGAMLVLGGMMAFAIIFTTMSVNIVERTREVATLRAGGVGRRTTAELIAAENLLVTLLGVVPGLAIGLLGGRAFLASYSNDQFQLSLVIRPTTLIIATACIVAVSALSQWPGLRAVGRLDLGQAVRERAS